MTGIALGAAIVAGSARGFDAAAAIAVALLLLRLCGLVSRPVAITVIVAACLGAVRSPPPPALEVPSWVDGLSAARGVVASGPMTSVNGQTFEISVREVRRGGAWEPATGTLCASAPGVPRLTRGDRWQGVASATRLADLRPPIGDVFAARGCDAAVNLWRVTERTPGSGPSHALDRLRQSLTRRLQRAAPGDPGALLAGLITGDDGGLSRTSQAAFVATGTTHITAVSGSNVALIVAFFLVAGRGFAIRRRRSGVAVMAAAVWGYAALVGLEPPAFRAALVATLVLAAVFLGRRPDLVTLTCLAAGAEVLIRPDDLWTLSFQLSFASSLALALVVADRRPGGFAESLRLLVVATAAAQFAAAPLLVASFGGLSPWSLPANVAIALPVGFAFPAAALAAAAALIWEPLGQVLAAPATQAASLILGIVEGIAALGDDDPAPGPSGGAGVLATTLTTVVAIGAVGLLSVDCRLGARRLWQDAREVPPAARYTVIASLVAFLLGATAALIR